MGFKMKCPGQDPRNVDPGAVREHACPRCGGAVEFFPDDRSRKCPACGARFRNPGLDVGCAEWCRFAAECVDAAAAGERDAATGAPERERAGPGDGTPS